MTNNKTNNNTGQQTASLTNNRLFMALTIIFFGWGVITCLNDLLIPHLKQQYHLNYAKSMLIQFCFFISYLFFSFPMAALTKRLHYKLSIITGILISAVGAGIMMQANHVHIYFLFLFGLFVLAAGVVMLQVSANPAVTYLGSAKKSSARLTLAQGINSLGYVLTPLVFSGLIFSGKINTTYAIMIAGFAILALIIYFSRFPKILESQVEEKEKPNSKINPRLTMSLLIGITAIFFYVGAEVSVGSLLINYLGLPDVGNLTLAAASKYLSFYWGGAMLLRLATAPFLTVFPTHKVLFVFTLGALACTFAGLFGHGFWAMWPIILLGVFNSIMFPSIFAMTLNTISHHKAFASGALICAIVGGAAIPALQALLADHIGLHQSYVVEVFCYGIIAAFSLILPKLKN